jgi:hypothetical protein
MRAVDPLAPLGCLALLTSGACAIVAIACSGTYDQRIGINAPDRGQFDPVGEYLDKKCGTLDCHGQTTRNLQMYGCWGLRLGDGYVPGCRAAGGKNTTEAEYDATYRSLVGLEPVVMSTVVGGQGVHPELLTFVRKARGTESHKGGQMWNAGDDADTCVTSWLSGQTDQGACTNAIQAVP